MKKRILIGKGKTAEVYEHGRDKVLKLYYYQNSDDRIHYEARIGKIIHEAGVPSPEVFDVIEANGGRGIIFQRIFGKTISEHIEAEPWKIHYYAKEMARFHYRIHKYSVDGLPRQKERFISIMERSSEMLGDNGKRIINYMKGLPDGNSICHGDMHFNNIIVSKKGLVAVDWISAYKGNPLGDVARACLTISTPTVSSKTNGTNTLLSKYTRRLICWTYLNEYMRLAKVRYEDIDAWILPVAAAKLKGKNTWDKEWLIKIINKYMQKYNL